MSPAKTKKLMRRRQKGPLQRRNARRDRPVTQDTRPRANAIIRPADASQGSNPVSQDLNATHAKRAIPSRPSKRDLATGRVLFPVDNQGKIQYLPIASEATPQERKLGLFVANDSIQKTPVNSLLDPATQKRPSVRDFSTKRTLFATLNAKGKREYLPKESEATALELSQGKYVPDDQVELPSSDRPLLDLPPRFDLTEQRNLFATRSETGEIEYLPQKSDATAWELSRGNYIDDDAISSKAPLGATSAMSPLKPTYDLGKGRQVYAVKTPEGKTLRLPRESDADRWERTQGLFIPDDLVDAHERQRKRTTHGDDADDQVRRAQRVAKLPSGMARQRNSLP